jgi:predicted tellurium resistance membrane protein TerC
MDWITDPQAWAGLLTLTVLEIVLGIDNIIFISILAGKLPQAQQGKARKVGLLLAMLTRILLLLSLAFLARLTSPLVAVLGHEISGRDLVLLVGGLFLLFKSTREIHERLEGHDSEGRPRLAPSFASVVTQIMLLDIVFSLDSVITAVGMVSQIPVMVTAIVVAVLVMMAFSGAISDFVHKHPSIKMLALAFLLMIGLMLVLEGVHHHIPRGYVYFSMAFSVGVEMLNIKAQSKARPVKLHDLYEEEVGSPKSR